MDFTPEDFLTRIPHHVALGVKLVKFEERQIILEMPYQEKLIGDPETGVIAGGVMTTLIDAACGQGVLRRLREPRGISTIDLRIEYLRAATPHRSILVSADCYRITRHVAFTRAVAYHADEEDDPIAHGNGLFSVSALTLAQLAAKRAGEAS